MARKLAIGTCVTEKPGTRPYWARGLVNGEVVEDRGGQTVNVRVLETTNHRMHTVGHTLWMERDCLLIVHQSKPCKLTFSWG